MVDGSLVFQIDVFCCLSCSEDRSCLSCVRLCIFCDVFCVLCRMLIHHLVTCYVYVFPDESAPWKTCSTSTPAQLAQLILLLLSGGKYAPLHFFWVAFFRVHAAFLVVSRVCCFLFPSSQPQSDMQAFKAANPFDPCLVDFVRWYSPKDFSAARLADFDREHGLNTGCTVGPHEARELHCAPHPRGLGSCSEKSYVLSFSRVFLCC